MKIGFIGLGIMGESMCENIVKKHDDTVYCFDFIPAKVELLASKGAVPCKDSVELAEKSDVIISMVPKSEHSMSVYKTILPCWAQGRPALICLPSIPASRWRSARWSRPRAQPLWMLLWSRASPPPLPASWASTWAAMRLPARPCVLSCLHGREHHPDG